MKILVILTGGTIACSYNENIINVDDKKKSAIVGKYNQKYNKNLNIEFKEISPFNILSENIDYSTWEELIKFINKIDFTKYKGIIVTHGSDTLSFTSALLGLYFAHIPIPMVLVASNFPVENDKSNGLQNFKGAVDFIKDSRNFKGVFTSYSNKKDTTDIYLSTRILESDSYNDFYSSYGNSVFATINNDKINLVNSLVNPKLEDVLKERKPIFNKEIKFKKKIKLIKTYPGIDYSNINIADNTGAVLHIGYHSGTAKTSGENNIIKLIKRCNESGIDSYFASMKRSEEVYQTTKDILNTGITPMFNIGLESGYAKLLLAYNQLKLSCSEIKKLINKNIFFEHIMF